jgi:OmcA/MtrC family decaheme c-type cytochrome
LPKEGTVRKSWIALAVLAMFLPVLFMGCEGDDGALGPQGIQGLPGPEGPQGPEGPSAAVSAVETCNVCHSDGKLFSATAAHAVTGQVVFSNATASIVGDDLVLTYNVKVDGVDSNAFTVPYRAYRYYYNAGFEADNVANAYVRDRIDDLGGVTFTVVSNGSGNYTATLDNVVPQLTASAVDNTYMLSADTAAGLRVTVIAGDGPDGALARSVVGNQGCIDCHDTNVFSGNHHGANPMGADACVVCHTRYNSVERGFGGARLTAYVHGIHNAHDMPSGEYVRRTTSVYHTTYPAYMTDCSVCHTTQAQLDIVNNAPVTGWLCLSCHDTMASWDFPDALGFHNSYTETTNCRLCHNDGSTGIARATVAEFHNGYINDPSHNDGQILDGRNVSFEEGKKFDVQITGVSVNSDNMAVTWTAAYDGSAVNPCNNDIAAGPVFHDGGSTTHSLLRAYGLGNDWVNDGIGTAPGQPVSTNLSTANTVCAGNVATSTIALTANEKASTAATAVVALQGKPTVRYDFGGTIGNRDIPVRAKTPTYEYVKSTGAAASTPRREIVDTALCLKCHVGTLYQHGGTRVDNVEMCVLCHNEASSETNVRVGYGVDPSEAYDGKAGQTYGFKSMLHALHSAGETGAPLVIYRTRGIYAWAADESVLKNWPGTGSQEIYGSDDGTGNPRTQTHNFHAPTYPRALNDCAACHVPGFDVIPDQTKAVATTLDAGAAPWSNQLDDVLEGPAAAACMSCHQSANPALQAALKGHAYQFGWVPAVFPNGREDILNP